MALMSDEQLERMTRLMIGRHQQARVEALAEVLKEMDRFEPDPDTRWAHLRSRLTYMRDEERRDLPGDDAGLLPPLVTGPAPAPKEYDPITGQHVYSFANRYGASVIPDKHRPGRFEVAIYDDVTEQVVETNPLCAGGIEAGLSTHEMETLLRRISALPRA